MKYALFLLSLLPAAAIAQKKLDGIGQFVIGKTTPAEVEKITGKTAIVLKNDHVKSYDTTFPFRDFKTFVMEIVKKDYTAYSPEAIIPDAHFLPGYRFIHISQLLIGGVNVKGIKLSFYRDTLFQIEANHDQEIEEAMSQNYGPARASKKELPITCTYRLTGASYRETEAVYTDVWTSGDVYAESYFRNYFDYNCKEKYESYFVVKSKKKAAEFKAKLAAEQRKKEQAEKASKQNSYKGF